MRLFIEPVEPLLLRTGRPFDAGADNIAESLFPPTPETIQGAIRATLATHWPDARNIAQAFSDPNFTQWVGDRESYGRFRITNITLGRYEQNNIQRVERLYPSPAHILCDDIGSVSLQPVPYTATERSNQPEGVTHYLAPSLSRKLKGKLKPLGGWLTKQQLRIALGVAPGADVHELKPISAGEVYSKESRLGIGMQNATKTTREGFLYQVQMIRMNPCYGFVVDVHLSVPSNTNEHVWLKEEEMKSTLKLPDAWAGWMTLGGEQRAARFWTLDSALEGDEHDGLPADGNLYYLATPAYFQDGWRPSRNFAARGIPITAAIHRYESIGGWKLNYGDARGESKISRRCVPAGSVYFFEERFSIARPFTEYGAEIGYGITFGGNWKR
jgi:CRISPR-associated protein Cmr3